VNTLHFVLHTLSPVNRSQASSFFLKYFLLLEKFIPDDTIHLPEIPIHGSLLSAKGPTFSFLKNYILPDINYQSFLPPDIVTYYFPPGNFLLPDQTAFSP
jgi:hypothetical protein